MAHPLNRFAVTALAAAMLLPAALPLTSYAQQTSDASATMPKPTKKKAKHKSAAIPAGSNASGSRPDPINPSGSPEPPTPTTQGPPPPATTPSTNTPVAPH